MLGSLDMNLFSQYRQTLWTVGLCVLTLPTCWSTLGLSTLFNKRGDVPAGYVTTPYYPTPPGGWDADWKASYTQAADLVSQMTLAEKVNLTTGTGFQMGPCSANTGSVSRLGIPQLCLDDGPLGVRMAENITAFPAGITIGATWNKDLMYSRGVAMGAEFRGKGINFFLGPVVGPIGRKPRGGRNWEGFGADPVLQAVAASQTIKGVQEQGVIATVKHYILNEQEVDRVISPVPPLAKEYSSDADDRTLHELYLWPFAEAVRAGVGAVMPAYNDVNGSACSQNSYLLNGILKDELGFQGIVLSDWWGQYSGVDAAIAGLDMDMPGDFWLTLHGESHWANELSRSVLNGSVPMDRINDMVTRIVATWFQLGQDQDFPEPNFSSWTPARIGPLYPGAANSPVGVVNEFVNVQDDHATVARKIATEAITLLKNDHSTLPIKTSSSLKVFGDDARANPDLNNPFTCLLQACDVGVLGMGWGSGSANYPYLDAPIDAIRRRAKDVTAYLNDTFPAKPEASKGDIAIVFINADSGEGILTVEGNLGDRTKDGLKAWHGGDELVRQAAKTYSTVIVVYHTVGPVLLESWIDLPSVKSVLIAHLPGQEAGDSIADVLFGDVSPSGKLPYTIPKDEADYPESVSIIENSVGQMQDVYSEGLYIDYRWFTKEDISVRYPFGHGLSYTSFAFSKASVRRKTPLTHTPPARSPKGKTPQYTDKIPPPSEVYFPDDLHRIQNYLYPYLEKSAADNAAEAANKSTYPYPDGYSTDPHPAPRAGGASGGNPALWDVAYTLDVSVKNTGKRPGKAVVQAYLQFPTTDYSGPETPRLQLRDFAKTATLKPGKSETVRLEFTRKDFSVWDVALQDWAVPNPKGRYGIYLGESVEDLNMVCWTDTRKCEKVGSK